MISELDRKALQRALDLTLAEKDQGRVEQIRSMLTDRSWQEVAEFCSYHRQGQHLSLQPWEDPPMCIDPDEIDAIIARGPNASNQYGGARLLKKMLAAGLSPFDPSPLNSLATKQRD